MVAEESFGGGDAAEAVVELAGAFGGVGGPHLEEAVGEAAFENGAGDGGEGGLVAEVEAGPALFPGAFEGPEGFGVFGAVADAAVGAEDFDEPGVGFAGGKAFGFEAHGDFVAVDVDFGVEDGVVPGVARGHAAFAVGTLGVDFLELGIDAKGFPAEAEGDVNDVHTEVAHDADFAAGFDLAFPIDRFVRVQIT
mgnify:CR=1 FL=1